MRTTYSAFGYYQYPATMSRFFVRKQHFSLTSMFKKFGYNE